MKYSVLLISLLVVACSLNREFKFTKLGYYKIGVPVDYLNYKVLTGNHGKEYQYWYKDSLLFYFSNETGFATPNYDNIRKNPSMEVKRTIAILENDTYSLEGKDENNLFWKEHFYSGFTIGYMNVSHERKETFERALESLRRK